jgi:hypothetical protein
MTPSSQDTLFVGRSQLFFPRGGAYDLKMPGIEVIGGSMPADDPYGYSYGYPRQPEGQLAGLNPVDDGTIHINRMDVNNLAFRELSYRQMLQAKPLLDTKLVTTAKGKALVIRNLGPERLSSISAIIGGKSFVVAAVEPGRQVTLDIPAKITPDPTAISESNYGYSSRSGQTGVAAYGDLTEYSLRTHQIVVKIPSAKLEFGPRIGQSVTSRNSVTVAYFTGIQYGVNPL